MKIAQKTRRLFFSGPFSFRLSPRVRIIPWWKYSNIYATTSSPFLSVSFRSYLLPFPKISFSNGRIRWLSEIDKHQVPKEQSIFLIRAKIAQHQSRSDSKKMNAQIQMVRLRKQKRIQNDVQIG